MSRILAVAGFAVPETGLKRLKSAEESERNLAPSGRGDPAGGALGGPDAGKKHVLLGFFCFALLTEVMIKESSPQGRPK